MIGSPVVDPFNLDPIAAEDAADLAETARRLLAELDRDVVRAATLSAECRPPLDVVETASTIEILIDVPGVPSDSLRVAIRREAILVVGAKLPPASEPGARFHLAERSYGRFARAVRIGGAVDAGRARGVVTSGQLRIVLPRIDERRGAVLRVPVDPA